MADSTDDAVEAPAWETFDDVVAELDVADGADSESEEPETAVPVPVPEAEEPETAAPVPEAEDPEPAEPVSKTETTPKRRKKKISFV